MGNWDSVRGGEPVPHTLVFNLKPDLFSCLPETHTTQREEDTAQTTDIREQATTDFLLELRPQEKTKKRHPSW